MDVVGALEMIMQGVNEINPKLLVDRDRGGGQKLRIWDLEVKVKSELFFEQKNGCCYESASV
jgi:hypothetical protein